MSNITKTPIKLIVGLGNPGNEYELTRHNAGFWFIEDIANKYNCSLKIDKKFKSITGRINSNGLDTHLLMPQTFMNLSGQSVQAFCQFYKILPNEILVAHDELDYPPGCIKLKQSGGSGGHNGVKDIMNKLGNGNFNRLRIGIGHPRNTNNKQEVHNYVLAKPGVSDKNLIMTAIYNSYTELDNILSGDLQKAMKNLH